MKIGLIGAGNLATQLGRNLQMKGFSVRQVYSRSEASAQRLGNQLHTEYTTRLDNVYRDADVYFFAVKDAALPEILQQFPSVNGLGVHTAGSVSIDVFRNSCFQRYGVFYPLQTFSKNRDISLEQVPVFIEARRLEDEKLLEKIASALSDTVIRLSSEKREQLHLAAVFACNFTNHIYHLAAQILEKQDIPYQILLPLIEETAAKIKNLHPGEAQTGPAVRYDTNIVNKQLDLLKDTPDRQAIYRLLSQSINRAASGRKTDF